MWGKDLLFQRDIPIHKDYAVLALVANLQNHVYSSGRDGSLRYFRVPWRNNNNDILLHAVAADVTGDENIAIITKNLLNLSILLQLCAALVIFYIQVMTKVLLIDGTTIKLVVK